MKIVCDACQAKYSISDDKVQGKVFKIRCKKCSNIIVVRGGAGAAEAAPPPQEKETHVYDYGYQGGDQPPAADDAVWHLVINQDQVGPMTVAEVQQRFAAGEVDGESFTWREGFADWLPLSQVDVFAGLVASGSTTAAHGGGGQAAVAAMFGSAGDEGTTRSDPGDLFASASAGARHQPDDDDGGDLFGQKPAAAAQSAANQKLRGERNENSVLFSLNNLAQLASDKPAMSAPTSSSSGQSMPSGPATGAAGGEGSGLIDIRSMANAYLGGSGAAMGAKPAAAIGSIDDLPVFGGGGFSEPNVIVPSARPSSNNKILYLMIGAVSLLAVVAIVMVVILMRGPAREKAPQVAEANIAGSGATKQIDKGEPVGDKGEPPAGSGATAGSAATPDKGSAAPPDKGTPPDKGSAAPPEKTIHNPPTPKHEPKATPPGTGGHEPKATPPKDNPKGTPKDPPPPKGEPKDTGACDEVSCVLNNYEGACCAKFRKGGGPKPPGGGGGDAPKPKSDLPDLDKSMISAGIAGIKARVNTCGDKSSAKGKVTVHVKVGTDGHVSNVTVESAPDPALGACVAAAVQKASFPKNANGGSFKYPFVF